MQDAMYSAMFGAMSNEIRVDLIANNMANVNTTGYKKDQVTFHDTFLRFAHDSVVDTKTYLRGENVFPRPDILAKPRLSGQYVDMSQGSLAPTGNPLDLAISGEGFFQVQTPDGDYLTRNGSFVVSSDGTLVTEQGYPVLGEGGPIVIPQGAQVQIDHDGVIRQGGAEVGQIGVYTVDDPTQLEKIGSNLFGVGGAALAPVPAENAVVQQGFLEKSNVEVVSEMVSLIESQRGYEAYSKVIKGSSELSEQLLQKVGRV
jgi:flagellar basal-body rod protein FlgG